jgi:hypothetical protein
MGPIGLMATCSSALAPGFMAGGDFMATSTTGTTRVTAIMDRFPDEESIRSTTSTPMRPATAEGMWAKRPTMAAGNTGCPGTVVAARPMAEGTTVETTAAITNQPALCRDRRPMRDPDYNAVLVSFGQVADQIRFALTIGPSIWIKHIVEPDGRLLVDIGAVP